MARLYCFEYGVPDPVRPRKWRERGYWVEAEDKKGAEMELVRVIGACSIELRLVGFEPAPVPPPPVYPGWTWSGWTTVPCVNPPNPGETQI